MPPEWQAVFARLADELIDGGAELEALAATLCCDAEIVARHAAALQTLDAVTQRLGATAAVLRAGDPAAAADALPLEEMRQRVQGARGCHA